MQTIGVIGLGTVGGALFEGLRTAGIRAIGYDPYLAVGSPGSLAGCSVLFLCVPTPSGPGGGLDVSAVWKAMGDVEASLPDGSVIAVKSTVPPGTTEALASGFPRFRFASVPEFLVSANPMETLCRPDRVVVGATSQQAGNLIADVLRRIAPDAPIVFLRPREAELAKLSANAMLAAKVCMANELALVCERFNVKWSAIQTAVGLDHRIGPDHLTVTAERGFDGGCLPKDLDGLIAASQREGYAAPLLEAIRELNLTLRRQDVLDRGMPS